MKTLIALALGLAASGAALATPSDIAAEYNLSFTGITIGHVSETYSRTGDRYAIRSVARAEGPLKMFLDDQLTLSSSGRVVATGLQPLEFEQHRANSSKGAVQATFDWAKGVMISDDEGKRSETPLPEQTQDRISVMYQFMNLKADPTVAMHMSNGRKVELYTYRLVDEPHIATPAGEFDTLHYERVVSGPKESKAEVWLAKDRFNFPVRVEFVDPKGFRVEQTLVGLTSR